MSDRADRPKPVPEEWDAEIWQPPPREAWLPFCLRCGLAAALAAAIVTIAWMVPCCR